MEQRRSSIEEDVWGKPWPTQQGVLGWAVPEEGPAWSPQKPTPWGKALRPQQECDTGTGSPCRCGCPRRSWGPQAVWWRHPSLPAGQWVLPWSWIWAECLHAHHSRKLFQSTRKSMAEEPALLVVPSSPRIKSSLKSSLCRPVCKVSTVMPGSLQPHEL